MNGRACVLAAAWTCAGASAAWAATPSDTCIEATPITGLGQFPFDLIGSTTDGFGHAACLYASSAQIWRDVWYEWESTVNGVVTVSTCETTTLDTRLAVYAPAASCAASTDEYVLACNDDSCETQSTVTFVAMAGQRYKIRIGRYGLSEPEPIGLGNIVISSAAQDGDICVAQGGPCQDLDPLLFPPTSSGEFRAAEDVQFANSGVITGVCWSGWLENPAADDFTITYWTNGPNGAPYAPIASFRQNQTMQVSMANSGAIGKFGEEIYNYTAAHPPVPVAGDTTYWVEIRNAPTPMTTWWWSGSPGGDALIDIDFPGTPPWDFPSSLGHNLALCVDFSSACAGDTDGDGEVNFSDLNNVLSVFNIGCP